MNPAPDIRFISTEETLPLRSAVLREGRPFDQCRFAEDGQPGSFHLGCFTTASPNPVAIASWYPKGLEGEPGGGFQLRGMAVARARQGSGLGSALLIAGERIVRERGLASYLWCNARVAAIAFYERHGWRVVSEPFDIPEVGPHRRMVKRLDGVI